MHKDEVDEMIKSMPKEIPPETQYLIQNLIPFYGTAEKVRIALMEYLLDTDLTADEFKKNKDKILITLLQQKCVNCDIDFLAKDLGQHYYSGVHEALQKLVKCLKKNPQAKTSYVRESLVHGRGAGSTHGSGKTEGKKRGRVYKSKRMRNRY